MARARRVKPDEELTLVEHLDELRSRIIIVLAVLAVGVAVCFYESGAILEYSRHALPAHLHNTRFLQTSPLDAIMTSISIAIYGGLLLTLPVATYQLYAFIVPAFSEEHHRHLRPLILMIPALFIAGAIFGWYLVCPPALAFLFNWNQDQFNVQLRAGDYIQFIMLTLLAMGLVFEMPAVMLVLAPGFEAGSERYHRGVHSGRGQQIKRGVPEIAEPRRAAEQATYGGRVQQSHANIAAKRGEELRQGHRHPSIGQDVGRKRGGDIERPVPPRRH